MPNAADATVQRVFKEVHAADLEKYHKVEHVFKSGCKTLEKLLQQHPHHLDARRALLLICLKMGEYEKAREHAAHLKSGLPSFKKVARCEVPLPPCTAPPPPCPQCTSSPCTPAHATGLPTPESREGGGITEGATVN